MPRVKVARISDVAVGSATIVDVGGVAVAVFHRPEGWFAIENTCTHQG
ncbi:MAG: Rieske 2Fe-2S domain-containing protein, partial [Candidatus Rokuibacteriota bacterium]